MIALFHATQIVICLFTFALTRNLWNAFVLVREYGYAPTVRMRRYRREFYAMAGLAVAASVMVAIAIVAEAVS